MFLGLDNNAAVACGLKDGLLTNSQKMKSPQTPAFDTLGDKSAVERIIVAQAYLADEDQANDAWAEKTVREILLNEDEQPAIRIMAMLVKYSFYLSVEDLQAAQTLWEDILAYSKNVPGDMNPASLESLNGESIYLMKRLAEREQG